MVADEHHSMLTDTMSPIDSLEENCILNVHLVYYTCNKYNSLTIGTMEKSLYYQIAKF